MIPLDTPLNGLRLAVIDTETTGLDPTVDAIVSIAVVHLTLGTDESPRLAYSSLVKPWRQIDPHSKAAEVNGILDEHVVDAPGWAEVWPEVAVAMDGRVPCAHNAPFDYGFVTAETDRHGFDRPLLHPWPWLCTQVPGKLVDRFKSGKRLSDIARRRGISLDAHGAAGDALAAAMVGPALWREALHGRRVHTLGDLVAWQERTAIEQEREFCEYMAKRDPTAARPSCGWHALLGRDLPPWPEPPAPTHQITKNGQIVKVGAP